MVDLMLLHNADPTLINIRNESARDLADVSGRKIISMAITEATGKLSNCYSSCYHLLLFVYVLGIIIKAVKWIMRKTLIGRNYDRRRQKDQYQHHFNYYIDIIIINFNKCAFSSLPATRRNGISFFPYSCWSQRRGIRQPPGINISTSMRFCICIA